MTLAEEKRTIGANELRAAFTEIWNEKMTDYEMAKTDNFVKLPSGYFLTFDKPTIKTDFCFGYDTDYSGHEVSDAYKRLDAFKRSEKAFKRANLEGLDEDIKDAKDTNKKVFIYTKYTMGGKIADYTICDPWKDPQILKDTPMWEASEEERKSIIKGLEIARAKFEKRLDSYLKKYGTSKLHCWTYWRDE